MLLLQLEVFLVAQEMTKKSWVHIENIALHTCR